MSAWIVSKVHIDAMVQAMTEKQTTPVDRDELGTMLWTENYRSVNYRYGEANEAPEYHFERTQDFPAVVILKAIDCYEYQTCEHDEWEQSYAKKFCEELRDVMIGRLPGYNEAPWGLDERFPTNG